MTNQYSIFNGVNHTVALYHQQDVVPNRNGEYSLLDPDQAKPYRIIPQNIPLSAYTNVPIITGEERDLNLALPDGANDYLEFPPNPGIFDIIIVSNRYAEFALQTPWMHIDYLDRLFVPIPVYKKYSKKDYSQMNYPRYDRTKIGSMGLKKIRLPRFPQEYLQCIQIGQRPSLAAIHTCLHFFKRQPCYDTATLTALQHLELAVSGN